MGGLTGWTCLDAHRKRFKTSPLSDQIEYRVQKVASNHDDEGCLNNGFRTALVAAVDGLSEKEKEAIVLRAAAPEDWDQKTVLAEAGNPMSRAAFKSRLCRARAKLVPSLLSWLEQHVHELKGGEAAFARRLLA